MRSSSTLGATTPLRIYVAWEDDRDGGTDLYFAASNDNGGSWSVPFRLNQGVAPGIEPVVTWDLEGDGTQVTAAWIDNRDGPASPPARDVFAISSDDAGANWGPETRIDLGTPAGTADSVEIDLAAAR